MSEESKKPKHACDALDTLEIKYLTCEGREVKEMGDHISVRAAMEWRKLFDLIRRPLGCPIRPKEVEKAYDDLP